MVGGGGVLPEKINKKDIARLRGLLSRLLSENIPKNTVYAWGLDKKKLKEIVRNMEQMAWISFIYKKIDTPLPLTGLMYGSVGDKRPVRFAYVELRSALPEEGEIGFSMAVVQNGVTKRWRSFVPTFRARINEYIRKQGRGNRKGPMLELEHYHESEGDRYIPKADISLNKILSVSMDPVLGNIIKRRFQHFDGLHVVITPSEKSVTSLSFPLPHDKLLSNLRHLLPHTHKILYKIRGLNPDAGALLRALGLWEALPEDHPLKNLRRKR